MDKKINSEFGAVKFWQNRQLTKNLPNFHNPNFYTSIVKSHMSVVMSILQYF